MKLTVRAGARYKRAQTEDGPMPFAIIWGASGSGATAEVRPFGYPSSTFGVGCLRYLFCLSLATYGDQIYFIKN